MNIDPPLISVILPTFNRADCLPLAIKSVLDQTYSKLELIVIDNSSADSTSELVHSYMSRDYRVRLLIINNNGIIARSRNYGIAHSRGKLIAFIDSDDLWHPDKLRLAVSTLETGVSLVYHDMHIVSQDSCGSSPKPLGSSDSPNNMTLHHLLHHGNSICNSSVVVRSSVLALVQGISESKSLVGAEDYHTWLKVLKAGHTARKLSGLLGTLTIRSDSMTTKLREYVYTQAILESYAHHLSNQLPKWAIYKLLSYQISHPDLRAHVSLWKKYFLLQSTFAATIRLSLLLVQAGLSIMGSYYFAKLRVILS